MNKRRCLYNVACRYDCPWPRDKNDRRLSRLHFRTLPCLALQRNNSSSSSTSTAIMSFMQHTPYSSFNSARGLTAAQTYGDTPPPMSAPSLAPPTPLQQTPNNFGMFGMSSMGSLPQQQQHLLQQEENKIYALVIDLLDANAREAALLELSKKREQYDDLALVLWHSFGELAIPYLFLKSDFLSQLYYRSANSTY